MLSLLNIRSKIWADPVLFRSRTAKFNLPSVRYSSHYSCFDSHGFFCVKETPEDYETELFDQVQWLHFLILISLRFLYLFGVIAEICVASQLTFRIFGKFSKSVSARNIK